MAPPASTPAPDNSGKSGEFSNAWDSLKNAGGSLWNGSVGAIGDVWAPIQEKTVDWFHKTKTVTADTLEKSKGYVDTTVKLASETVASGREKTGNLIHTVQERQQDVAKALQGKANERAETVAAPPPAGKTTARGELDYVKVCLAAGLAVLLVQGVIVGVALYKNNKKSGGDDKPAKNLDD